MAHISVQSVQDCATTALCLGVKGEVRCVSHVITGGWAVCVCACMRCILYERERMAHIQYNYNQVLFFKRLLYLMRQHVCHVYKIICKTERERERGKERE